VCVRSDLKNLDGADSRIHNTYIQVLGLGKRVIVYRLKPNSSELGGENGGGGGGGGVCMMNRCGH